MREIKGKNIRFFGENAVVNELLANCKQSIGALAASCKMSKQRVWRNIKKLEDNNTIWGYSAVIDDTKLGFGLYVALIKGGPPSSETVEKIIERHKNPKVAGREHVMLIESYYVNGIYDWVLMFAASSIAEAKKYCGSLQMIYGDFVKSVEMLEVMLPVARSGVINPEIQHLQDFAIPNSI